MPRQHITRFICILALLFALFTGMSAALWAEEHDERRVSVGFKLFPAVLAADEKIREKPGQDGALLLLLLYTDHINQAEALARDLRAKDNLQGIPLRVEPVSIHDLNRFHQTRVAGIFLTQPMNEDLSQVIRLGRTWGAIIFSPFVGDVEEGVTVGLSVTDRVLPLLNRSALEASGIILKPIFLSVAKYHEP